MKSLYTLILAAALSAPVCAQSSQPAPAERPHLLDFGVGQSINGTGDYRCLKTHLGYTHTLGRHLSAGPRLSMISGAADIYFGPGVSFPQTYQAVNLEGELYYAPFGNDRRFVFALGAGAYVGYTKQYGYDWISYGPNQQQQYELIYQAHTTRGYHVGYLASLNADYAVDHQQRWLLGLKVALQNDTYGNVLPGAQLRVARRL